MDPGRAPLRVFLAHPLDEIAQATIDLWPPCPHSGFPAPESFEARAMPAKDGLRLNHLGRTEQARPEPGHPYQQRPVTAAQSKTRRRTPQGDAELMTEKQVLGFKPAPRLEQVAFAERLIGSIRRECVDRIIVFSEAQLRRILTKYAAYYNELRTNRSLNKDAPFHRAIQRLGAITSQPVLGGLHH